MDVPQSDLESVYHKASCYEKIKCVHAVLYIYAVVLVDYVRYNPYVYQWYMIAVVHYVPAKFNLIFLSHVISEQIFKFNMLYTNTL